MSNNILIADKNKECIDICTLVFEDIGDNPFSYRITEELMHDLEQQLMFNAAIIDVALPIRDTPIPIPDKRISGGILVMREIKKRFPSVPVVAISYWDLEYLQSRYPTFLKSADDFYYKSEPFSRLPKKVYDLLEQPYPKKLQDMLEKGIF